MSSSYQFSRWYEVPGSDDVKGSSLHSPRIREDPPNITSQYATHSVMYRKKTRDWKDYRNATEDWENTKVSPQFSPKHNFTHLHLSVLQSVNLSYQDLGDAYQLKELQRCLRRLVHCTHLQLTDNCLTDLGRVTLPMCTHLNLSRNSFSSLRKLPSASNLQHLSITDNHFTTIPAFSSKYKNLKSLYFRGNPVEFSTPAGYRRK